MSRSDAHAELGEVIAGLESGPSRDEETIVLDSSGTPLQEVAAAVAAYRRALEHGEGPLFLSVLNFSRRNSCVTNSHPYIAVPGS
jgi:ornithine cyclodeaminase/alanine dehydrogenase-like protein (mu-crystallin family)